MNLSVVIDGVGEGAGKVILIVLALAIGLPIVYSVVKVAAAAIYDARLDYERKKQQQEEANHGKTEETEHEHC